MCSRDKGRLNPDIYLFTMFERYTEKARRTIFFARYEASQYGSPYIETEHLLLGLLREDRVLATRFLLEHATAESIKKRIDESTTVRQGVSTSVDLPLSNESKRVLAYAAEEAERLANQHIDTEHLLLGLLRERRCFAAVILNEVGINLEKARESIAAYASESGTSESASGFTRVHGASSIEFRCGNEMIATVMAQAALHIPRIGEQVVFKNKEGADVRYRVEGVRHVYESEAPGAASTPLLSRAIVEIARE